MVLGWVLPISLSHLANDKISIYLTKHVPRHLITIHESAWQSPILVLYQPQQQCNNMALCDVLHQYPYHLSLIPVCCILSNFSLGMSKSLSSFQYYFHLGPKRLTFLHSPVSSYILVK